MPISISSHAMRRLFAPILFVGVFMASGCTQTIPAEPAIENASTPEINQRKLCHMDSPFDFNAGCERGQKVVFLPSRWGNEQLPVIFAAWNCDMRYSIALTKGAVTCIYLPPGGDDEPEGGDGTDDEASDETSADTPDETPSEP